MLKGSGAGAMRQAWQMWKGGSSMMPDNQLDHHELPEGREPLPNRIPRGTLLGCLGLCCVLAMPALFFLPLESFGEPCWMQLLVPLVAFALVAFGAALLARVPPGVPLHSNDPRFPLTGVGALPLRELPATGPNRVALGVVGLLLAGIAFGVVLAIASDAAEPALLSGEIGRASC